MISNLASYPQFRGRRLRANPALRAMAQETRVLCSDLILPLFITEGSGLQKPIASMPEVFQLSIDCMLKEAEALVALGIPAVLLFGVPSEKDLNGKYATDEKGLIPRAVKALKTHFPSLIVITDVCLCEWLSHGHCGLVQGEQILNDESLPVLSAMAVAHAHSGADMVAPSDMMDGRVQAIRQALDAAGYEHTPIMAYSTKFASCLYGPFREAGEGAPEFGDRKTYQLNPANAREAMLETLQDIAEGADVVMVKPAMTYLDILSSVRAHTLLPLAAYHVSGEYAMIWAAANQGWLPLEDTMLEVLHSIKRAGADWIITYFAKRAAALLP